MGVLLPWTLMQALGVIPLRSVSQIDVFGERLACILCSCYFWASIFRLETAPWSVPDARYSLTPPLAERGVEAVYLGNVRFSVSHWRVANMLGHVITQQQTVRGISKSKSPF